MEKEKTKTIRISLELWREINSRRGLNGCNTFEDVIKSLLKENQNDN